MGLPSKTTTGREHADLHEGLALDESRAGRPEEEGVPLRQQADAPLWMTAWWTINQNQSLELYSGGYNTDTF